MNKKAEADIRTVAFSIVSFILILSGSLFIANNFFVSNNIQSSQTFNSLDSISNSNATTAQYLGDISQTNRDVQEEKTGIQRVPIVGDAIVFVQDRFEDSMLGKAFKTAKVLGDAEDVITEGTSDPSINTAIGLKDAPWIAWSIGIVITLAILFAVIYFFRGLR